MRIIVRGVNYTEIETSRTIQFWARSKDRKPEDCGVWVDGEKVRGFDDMEDNRRDSPHLTTGKERQKALSSLDENRLPPELWDKYVCVRRELFEEIMERIRSRIERMEENLKQ